MASERPHGGRLQQTPEAAFSISYMDLNNSSTAAAGGLASENQGEMECPLAGAMRAGGSGSGCLRGVRGALGDTDRPRVAAEQGAAPAAQRTATGRLRRACEMVPDSPRHRRGGATGDRDELAQQSQVRQNVGDAVCAAQRSPRRHRVARLSAGSSGDAILIS